MRLLAALLGAILILVTASPADAAPSGRAVRLARTVGVDITVPAAVHLGAGMTGGTLTGQLGTVEVRDSRGSVDPNTWVAAVSATDFIVGTGGPGRTIAADRISYWSGPAVRSAGGGTLAPGQPTSAQAVTLGVAREAFRKTGGNGNNAVAWSPTIRVAIPVGVVAGGYRGTIVHSVA
ncbi:MULTISPECIES: hypothetical protein [unclassified Micromonospora]|uniref:hypothetical protein n=1 Tax=unclassified Micromonospora TaxID=2617518 RepID=UPI00331BC712